jgi:hypothetical protein
MTAYDLLTRQDDQPTSYSCRCCGNYGYCAADCAYAPWNQDRSATSPFAYLVRQRGWVGWPVERLDSDRVLLSLEGRS